ELARRSLQPAHWRALVDARRGPEAVAPLTAALDDRPDDLALWEILRIAARQAEDWSLVALCCDRLAQYLEGSLRADLLEEAALVRLDQLGQQPQAEDLFRAALEADPTREVAFRRLHDLLTAREDADALQALVAARLERGGADGREELLYERARLLRGFSERAEALEVLDQLFSASPDHPGALALAAEIHVSLERWEEAVVHLTHLARADIPREQKRVAHLGAADFLERHLERPEDALAQLRAVDDLGLADAAMLTRIAGLERRRGNENAAADACERALGLDPTHRQAMEASLDLVDTARLSRMLTRFENAIWTQIERGRLDEDRLELLRDAAVWGGQKERASAVEEALTALRSGATSTTRVNPGERFDRIDASALPGAPPDPVVLRLMRQVGPLLDKTRTRSRRKIAPGSPIYAQLDQLCRRVGGAIGQVAHGAPDNTLVSRLNRHEQLDWLVPAGQPDVLSDAARFEAGRLAWITTRGARSWLDVSAEEAAGQLAGILRAGRREPAPDIGGIPHVDVKLPRAGRRLVGELIPEGTKTMTAVLDDVRWFQRGADQAGLVACGHIGPAMSGVLGSKAVTIEEVRASKRAIGLLRFWLHHESILWGAHG
ncbi:MAG: tetratricopeptide repeat protein, partial [Polyangiales bacterium]